MRSALTNIDCFIRALSHKIRTPLSIVLNELTCIKSKIDEEEYKRIVESCKSINQALKKGAGEIVLKNDYKKVKLNAFLPQIFESLHIKHTENQNFKKALIIADPLLLEGAFKGLVEFLQMSKSAKSKLSLNAEFKDMEDRVELNIVTPFIANNEKESTLAGDSFSEFFCMKMDYDSLLLPIIDSIFSDHLWEVQVLFNKNNIQMIFDIPCIYE